MLHLRLRVPSDRTDAVVEPGAEAAAYAELLPVYRRLYAETRGVMHALHDPAPSREGPATEDDEIGRHA